MDDAELARRAILSFGELVAALGLWSAGTEAVVRWPNVLGARIDAAATIPWFNAAVVPAGESPPEEDDPRLPYCLWTVASAVPGRVEDTGVEMPCMGIELENLVAEVASMEVEVPSLAEIGDMNERAYGDTSGEFGPLVEALQDDRVRTHGYRDSISGGVFVCVALTLAIGDDISIHYVATEASHRRRGLASSLIRQVLAGARAQGMRTATLQASKDGLSVYERLGFRRVAMLHGFLRPAKP